MYIISKTNNLERKPRKNLCFTESPNDSPIDNSTNISEEVDFIIPKHKMIRNRSMSYLNSLESKKKLDNVWLATIAGGRFQKQQGVLSSLAKTSTITLFFR